MTSKVIPILVWSCALAVCSADTTHQIIHLVWASPASGFSNWRASVIELAWRHHPSSSFAIYSNTLAMTHPALSSLLEKGCNVSVVTYDHLFADSPLQGWWEQEKQDVYEVQQGVHIPHKPFLPNCISNAVRILAVWKYGGLYMDFDVITLRSMAPLHNFCGKSCTSCHSKCANTAAHQRNLAMQGSKITSP
jgi:lactosylceramide 4-alpha-galactosyltransferase